MGDNNTGESSRCASSRGVGWIGYDMDLGHGPECDARLEQVGASSPAQWTGRSCTRLCLPLRLQGWLAGWLAAPPPPVPAGQAGCSLPPVPARLAVPLLHKLAGLAGCSPPPVPAGLAVPLLHKLAALLEGGGAGGVVLRAAVAPPVAVAEGVVGCAADKDATCSGKEHGGSG